MGIHDFGSKSAVWDVCQKRDQSHQHQHMIYKKSFYYWGLGFGKSIIFCFCLLSYINHDDIIKSDRYEMKMRSSTY